MDNEKIAELALERISHLETILASSLFGLIITTTLALFGAAYYLQKTNQFNLPVLPFIVGANILYGFISGYYYFMLIHFYAVTTVTLASLRDTVNFEYIENAWLFFETSGPLFFMSDRFQTIIGLFLAPSFPALISCISVTGLWYYLRKTNKGRVGWLTLFFSTLFHIVIFFFLIFNPFKKFISSLNI